VLLYTDSEKVSEENFSKQTDLVGPINSLASLCHDITPSDLFFLCGYIQGQAIHPKVGTVVELRELVNTAVGSDTPDAGKHIP
jgi:hypothetical protein